MIDVCVSGNEDDIDSIPAAFKHFWASERERFRHGYIVTQDGDAAIVRLRYRSENEVQNTSRYCDFKCPVPFVPGRFIVA